MQVHSTGANNPYLHRYVGPDDGRLGPNKYGNTHNRPGGNVCASAYIGKLEDGSVAVYQALPWEYRCWLSGSGPNGNANRKGFLGFEICEDGLTDEGYYRAAMEAAELLTAHWCQEYGIDPDAAVRDHKELHSMGLASNHGDITAWLRKFGDSMAGFRAKVKEILAEGISVQYIDCDEEKTPAPARPTLRKGSKGDSVKELQELLSRLGYDLGARGIDGDFGRATEAAVRAFQERERITVDGIVGAVTWTALQLAAGQSAGEEQLRYTVTIPGLTLAQAQALLDQHPGAAMAQA